MIVNILVVIKGMLRNFFGKETIVTDVKSTEQHNFDTKTEFLRCSKRSPGLLRIASMEQIVKLRKRRCMENSSDLHRNCFQVTQGDVFHWKNMSLDH